MKITIVVDNQALEFLLSEFGFSCYIEIDDKKLLFDTGYSGIFLQNASLLGINLYKIDFLILSHGHHDHTWGLANLIQNIMQKVENKKHICKPTLVCCPGALEPKWLMDGYQNGLFLNKETLASFFNIQLTNQPMWLSENMVFLGKIERKLDFEKDAYKENVPPGKTIINGTLQEDQLLDDSAIACKTKNGLVIITGCSHSGICNIVEYAKKVTNQKNVYAVIGGFHLKELDDITLKTIEYLKKERITKIFPLHCTSKKVKEEFSKKLGSILLRSGDTISI